MGRKDESSLEELIVAEVANLGLKFVKLEFDVSKKDKILRIYIDKVGGVTIDDCSTANYHLDKVLSVSPQINLSNYILEVSSPGVGHKK